MIFGLPQMFGENLDFSICLIFSSQISRLLTLKAIKSHSFQGFEALQTCLNAYSYAKDAYFMVQSRYWYQK